ncbi:hypothetical protein HK098_000530, partial [Nowakowskiella sp. JEL0407]
MSLYSDNGFLIPQSPQSQSSLPYTLTYSSSGSTSDQHQSHHGTTPSGTYTYNSLRQIAVDRGMIQPVHTYSTVQSSSGSVMELERSGHGVVKFDEELEKMLQTDPSYGLSPAECAVRL